MFDLLIKEATVVDGTCAEPWIGDVAITNGRFDFLDTSIDSDARRFVSARGCILAPGFIDIHCHAYDRVADAHRALESGTTVGKLILKFSIKKLFLVTTTCEIKKDFKKFFQ